MFSRNWDKCRAEIQAQPTPRFDKVMGKILNVSHWIPYLFFDINTPKASNTSPTKNQPKIDLYFAYKDLSGITEQSSSIWI